MWQWNESTLCWHTQLARTENCSDLKFVNSWIRCERPYVIHVFRWIWVFVFIWFPIKHNWNLSIYKQYENEDKANEILGIYRYRHQCFKIVQIFEGAANSAWNLICKINQIEVKRFRFMHLMNQQLKHQIWNFTDLRCLLLFIFQKDFGFYFILLICKKEWK